MDNDMSGEGRQLVLEALHRLKHTDNPEGAVWRLIDAAGLLMEEYFEEATHETGRFVLKSRR